MNRIVMAALVWVLPLSVHAAEKKAKEPGSVKNGLLADQKGMTLYFTAKDAPNSGKSTCNGPCAEMWPPFSAPADAAATGSWTIVTRDDGSKQWAYSGMPVYRWKNDKKPGDTTGDNVGNVWHTITVSKKQAAKAKSK